MRLNILLLIFAVACQDQQTPVEKALKQSTFTFINTNSAVSMIFSTTSSSSISSSNQPLPSSGATPITSLSSSASTPINKMPEKTQMPSFIEKFTTLTMTVSSPITIPTIFTETKVQTSTSTEVKISSTTLIPNRERPHLAAEDNTAINSTAHVSYGLLYLLIGLTVPLIWL